MLTLFFFAERKHFLPAIAMAANLMAAGDRRTGYLGIVLEGDRAGKNS